MFGAERILDQIFRVCLYLRSQRLAHQVRRTVSGGGLAGVIASCRHCPARGNWLAYIQALAGYGTMVVTERSGL